MGNTETPEPITAKFKVPNATYKIVLGVGEKRVSLVLDSQGREFRGTGIRVRANYGSEGGESEWRTLSSDDSKELQIMPEPPWWAFWRPEPVKPKWSFQLGETYLSLGTHTVTSGEFTLELATVPDMAAFLHEVLFIPQASSATRDISDDEIERLESLRALGYVE